MHRAIIGLALGIGLAPAGAIGAADAPPAAGAADRPHRGSVTVFALTECTDAGRQVPAPSAEQPVYVLIHCAGQHDVGEAHAADPSPTEAALDAQLRAALGVRHYQMATADHPPSVVLFYNWGIHGNPGADLADLGLRNLLDRAALVGGRKFAADLQAALQAETLTAGATSNQPWGAQLPGMRPTSAAGVLQSVSPLEMFRRRDRLTSRLIDEIADDVYYFIVSAFDHAALSRGEQRLLWRTKMSTSARGTSMAAALPALIRGGAPHFGQELPEAAQSAQPTG
ncbi:MAG TPA: hypothetical protein VLT83_01295 [Opitutaceae bacterium]|nr:hypothetical protein [Opitutaceae bacterium]